MANKKNRKQQTARYTWAPAMVNDWKATDLHPVIFDENGNYIPATHNPNNATGALENWDVTRDMAAAAGRQFRGACAQNTTYLKGAYKNCDITVAGPTRKVPAKYNQALDAIFKKA